MARKRALRIKNRCSRRIRVALQNRRYGDTDLSDIIERSGQGDLDAIHIDPGSILECAGEHDVDTVRPLTADLLGYHNWLVRADAVELVGMFHMHEFLGEVKARLHDSNPLVREYALGACYDLLGKRALPLLKEASKDRTVSYRVVALVLRYIETRDEAILPELRRILTMKRCRFASRYAALRTFDVYVDVGLYPEIIHLFEEVLSRLPEAPRKYGLDKDIPARLRRWKRSAREHRRKPKGKRTASLR